MNDDEKIKLWMKHPQKKGLITVKKWLVKELKCLRAGIKCVSYFDDDRYCIDYKAVWSEGVCISIDDYKVSATNKNPINMKIADILNFCEYDDLLDLVSLTAQFKEIEERVKHCFNVANTLELIDEEYSWFDTMKEARL
ncbi:MAG: hypothetical protein EKK64_06895 [Neisseriaceae bacterium]|nr:MAG: hypothetical protein EKK64_06895 [Neisseriaceae bacterium]